MTLYIQLIIAGEDVGPFDLYSDVDGFTTPFETGIIRQILVDGFLCSTVPDGTTQIKIQSTGVCENYVIVDVITPVTTTTSTTAIPVTTTTTTTTALGEFLYVVTQCPPSGAEWIIDPLPGSTIGIGDTIQFTIGVDPTKYCGTVTDMIFPGTSDGIQTSFVSYPCDDDIHCYQGDAPLTSTTTTQL